MSDKQWLKWGGVMTLSPFPQLPLPFSFVPVMSYLLFLSFAVFLHFFALPDFQLGCWGAM